MVGKVTRKACCCLLVIVSVAAAMANDLPSYTANAPSSEEQAKPARGRLPAHYGKVIDARQREAIYRIQQEYRPKIDALRKQLKDLYDEQTEKIAAILTPEQKKQIEALKASAKQTQPAKKAPESDAAAVPPTK